VPGPLASPVALARGALRLAALGPLLLGCLGLDARGHGPLHDLRAQPRDRPARAMDGVRLPGHGVHADHRRHGAARHGTRRRQDQGAARLDGDQHANGGTSPRDGLVVWPSRVRLAGSWTAGGQPVWTVHPLPLEPTGVELLVVDDDDAFVQLDVLAPGLGVDRDNITIKPRKRWRGYGDQRLDSRRRPPRLNPRHLELLRGHRHAGRAALHGVQGGAARCDALPGDFVRCEPATAGLLAGPPDGTGA
jgi:hypothetical protein